MNIQAKKKIGRVAIALVVAATGLASVSAAQAGSRRHYRDAEQSDEYSAYVRDSAPCNGPCLNAQYGYSGSVGRMGLGASPYHPEGSGTGGIIP